MNATTPVANDVIYIEPLAQEHIIHVLEKLGFRSVDIEEGGSRLNRKRININEEGTIYCDAAYRKLPDYSSIDSDTLSIAAWCWHVLSTDAQKPELCKDCIKAATALYLGAIGTDRKSHKYRSSFVEFLLCCGNYDAALEWAKALCEDYPEDFRANLNYGLCLFHKNMIYEAKPYFQNALKLEPGNESATRFLIRCAQKKS